MVLQLQQDAAQRAAQHAAILQGDDASALSQAAQQRPSVAAQRVAEEEFQLEALGLVLPALESMAVQELRVARASWVAGTEAAAAIAVNS